MTLWVTRQGQDFVTSGDLQLCDVELLNASVELVGEPGQGNAGKTAGQNNNHNTTINFLNAVNDASAESTVYGVTGGNRVLAKTHINHGHVNVNIIGMTQGHQFRRDTSIGGNDISLLIPTDNGIIPGRIVNWPANSLTLENVHLQQNLRVECAFAGTWPVVKRVCRFVEDWADTPGGTKRNADGTVRYYVNDDEGQSSSQECQVPSNLINAMKLVFKVTPRIDL